jgi:hypothetical protein
MASSSQREFYVANFDRLHGDAPGIGFLVEDALQLAAHHFALGNHLRQFVAADRFAQRGLRAHVDGVDEVLDFENGFLGVPYQPENDGVHVHGNGVAGESGLGGNAGYADALVDIRAERFDDRNNVAQAGTAQADVAAQAQHRDLFPLLHHFDREQKIEPDESSDDGRYGIVNCR